MQTAINNILALDYGERRIGVAVANTLARLPQPLKAIEQSAKMWKDMRAIIDAESIDVCVIGLPRNLSGDDTAQTKNARAFAKELEERMQLPVFLQDEALTSVQAEAELTAHGKRFDKGMVDSLAAVYILGDYLAAHQEYTHD
jgi:putative Holliday junction resolvase